MKTLRDVVPQEFFAEFMDTTAAKHLDIQVGPEEVGSWPGKHRYIVVWWKLDNGYAVGWNENPARGWSFPLIHLK